MTLRYVQQKPINRMLEYNCTENDQGPESLRGRENNHSLASRNCALCHDRVTRQTAAGRHRVKSRLISAAGRFSSGVRQEGWYAAYLDDRRGSRCA